MTPYRDKKDSADKRPGAQEKSVAFSYLNTLLIVY
jgi:hypothetical protein